MATLFACQNQTSNVNAENSAALVGDANPSKIDKKLVFAKYESVENDSEDCSGDKKVIIKLYGTRAEAAQGGDNVLNEEIYCKDGKHFEYQEKK